ncbi:MAG: SufE family protein, partial [Proteobacteria bacterium]
MSSAPTQLTPSQEILDAQAEIVEIFSMFDDWTDRYQYIIDLGRKLADLPSAQKIESNRLKGC